MPDRMLGPVASLQGDPMRSSLKTGWSTWMISSGLVCWCYHPKLYPWQPWHIMVPTGSNMFHSSLHLTLLPLANSFPSSNLGIAIQHEVNLHSSLWSADTPADQRAVWLSSGCHWKSGTSLQSPKIIVMIRMRRMRMRMRMIAIIIMIISSSSSSSSSSVYI
jgi:hypothetical protein